MMFYNIELVVLLHCTKHINGCISQFKNTHLYFICARWFFRLFEGYVS